MDAYHERGFSSILIYFVISRHFYRFNGKRNTGLVSRTMFICRLLESCLLISSSKNPIQLVELVVFKEVSY